MLAQFVLFDGFDPLDVIAPYEVLGAGGTVTGGSLEVELVAAEGAREVPSGVDPVSLRATGRLDPERADLVIVPGAMGRMPTDAEDHRDDSVLTVLVRALGTELSALLKEAMARPGLTVASVCGGSLLLGFAGLLTGRPATTHPLGMTALARTGARVVDARVIDDGDLICGAGVTSGLDVGLYLLERELGPQVAHAVEQLIAYERRGTVWRNTGSVPVAA
ncbi:DJ-1/PfpI family protein [Nocardia ninae]|uniref:Glutamine amidotransferase n=1 Tax=Nocardia ninae NBRC 108245 TaxID=1210091 RepID=A0A511MJA7_9NOCA|nr:DJ-1/PfpI family protein [Nocardia ninae]GEM40551.1 glutamine amidotransferase [Nocardia ninae NBRC 108245]